MTARESVAQALDKVHPELRGSLSGLLLRVSRVALNARWLKVIRVLDAVTHGVASVGTAVHVVPGAGVRVYVIDQRPDPGMAGGTPALLHIHGGGFVFGRPGVQFSALKRVSRALNCLVVSVDYRLAPETPFPGALEDNYAALRWLHEQAGALRVDGSRVAVMGESAGGGHAAALTHAVRARGELGLCFQVLIYPMLDDRTGCDGASGWSGHFVWSAGSNRFGWGALLGGFGNPPSGSVPAREEDLRGLPPAWVGVGELDLFYAEDVAYARRLEAAGVATQLYVQGGAFHGFDLLARKTAVAKAFTQSWIEALGRGFGS